MKNVVLVVLLASFAASFSHAQIASGLKDKISKKDKKDKSSQNKDIGVEFTEDEFGISGVYYTWQPEGSEWFKKIPQVVIQYTPEDGKIEFHVSKKESIDSYRTDDYIKTYKMVERCGEFGFSDYRKIGPDLWTNEPGMFMDAKFSRNTKTCEITNFDIEDKTFIMSKDKEFIDNMTLEKFKELYMKKRGEACMCYRDWRSGADPVPARKMRDSSLEEAALQKVKARAAREGWKEEILGVYIASEAWTKKGLWVTSTGEWTRSDRVNAVIVMKHENTCSYQRMVLAANETVLYNENEEGGGNMYDREGINIVGVVPENNYLNCAKAEELLK